MKAAPDDGCEEVNARGEPRAGREELGRKHVWVLVACLALGGFLRLRGLRSQIPLDDEWHGLDFALSRDLWFLFTHFSRAGANSIPFNLYLRALLDTFGWTEVSIVLPSLLAGLGLLWVFPRWVCRRFGALAAVVTAILLATAPFLVFYSRVARAYSAVLLLECLALLALCEWLHTARRRHAVGLVVFGALAIWTHASALPPLVAALAAAAGHGWIRSQRAPAALVPSARQVMVAGLGMLGLAGALWLPALWTPMPVMWLAPTHFTGRTFLGAIELLSGTDAVSLQVAYLVLALVGVGLAARMARQELFILGAAVAGSLLVVLLARPNASGVAGVFVRYFLPAFLLASLAIGVAVETAVRVSRSRTRQGVLLATALCLLTALVAFGPLPRLYGATNSFTKHPVFQFDYAKDDPDRARIDPLEPDVADRLRRSELQPFYSALSRKNGHAPVIEYPFVVDENANLLYFAQQVHGRPVLAGYYRSGALDVDAFGLAAARRSSADLRQPSPGYIMSGMTVDHVLGRPHNDSCIRFHTVIDIADPKAVSRSKAEYLILHWNTLREFFHIGPGSARSWFVANIRGQLAARYGAPAFENAVICVFRLNSAS
ncbi:MAG TPA: DUF6541 family protein [Polyangia bacterium]